MTLAKFSKSGKSTAPVLRAESSIEDDAYDDPSEDALFMLLEDIAGAGEGWLVVDRLVGEDQVYAQTMLQADGSWVIEHRAGCDGEHLGAIVPTMREVHHFLTSRAFGHSEWDQGHHWYHVRF